MPTLAEAREKLNAIRPHIEELITLRADLAELRADLAADGMSRLGGVPEAKGLEARLYGILESFAAQDVQVKGYAPILLDIPGELAARPILWCWLEGDQDIAWYHRVDCGFAGRRRV